jgi:hypothetical protein
MPFASHGNGTHTGHHGNHSVISHSAHSFPQAINRILNEHIHPHVKASGKHDGGRSVTINESLAAKGKPKHLRPHKRAPVKVTKAKMKKLIQQVEPAYEIRAFIDTEPFGPSTVLMGPSSNNYQPYLFSLIGNNNNIPFAMNPDSRNEGLVMYKCMRIFTTNTLAVLINSFEANQNIATNNGNYVTLVTRQRNITVPSHWTTNQNTTTAASNLFGATIVPSANTLSTLLTSLPTNSITFEKTVTIHRFYNPTATAMRFGICFWSGKMPHNTDFLQTFLIDTLNKSQTGLGTTLPTAVGASLSVRAVEANYFEGAVTHTNDYVWDGWQSAALLVGTQGKIYLPSSSDSLTNRMFNILHTKHYEVLPGEAVEVEHIIPSFKINSLDFNTCPMTPAGTDAGAYSNSDAKAAFIPKFDHGVLMGGIGCEIFTANTDTDTDAYSYVAQTQKRALAPLMLHHTYHTSYKARAPIIQTKKCFLIAGSEVNRIDNPTTYVPMATAKVMDSETGQPVSAAL